MRSINVPQCLSCKTGRSTQPGLQEQKRGGVFCKSSQVTVLKDFTSDCDVIQLDNLEYDTVWHHAWGHCLLFLPFKDSWFLYVPPGLALNSSPFCPQVHYCDFWARSQSWEKRLLALSCLFFRVEQIGSHWTDFREVICWGLLVKFVENIQISVKSDENIRHFTWRPRYVYDISPNSSWNETKKFELKVVEKIKVHVSY